MSQVIRHVFSMPDFSVFVVDGQGSFMVISSNARAVLNEVGGKVAMGNDCDYLKLLTATQKEFSPCVFYGSIDNWEEQSKIFNRNVNGDVYNTLNYNITLQRKSAYDL